jgi:hypothetical protein
VQLTPLVFVIHLPVRSREVNTLGRGPGAFFYALTLSHLLHFRTMAKLTISDAARVAGVSRSTLHRAIKQGRISLDPDGRLDTAELLRAGYMLQQALRQPRTRMTQDATPQRRNVSQGGEVPADREFAALEREREVLQRELDATRELMRQEREAALERERASRERETLLLQMLQETQRQNQRLLDAPAWTSPTISALSPAVTSMVSDRILDYMRQHPGPMRPAEIRTALHLPTTPRHAMKRMVGRGLLKRVEQGVYTLGDAGVDNPG